ncbi:NAD(P)/FAD-dependent oxidoreductase [Leucobacter sp. L43]|uniref:NAD(P)/FAD-dependent oxidoreductase n=1 Tax=Leucobacter sp. L43 TaxID=2798040 RepID=UPI0019048DA9|nr:FAD/NAD(P)-binding oxidoreductase [Leucobacter sp. L43]
MKTTVIVGAGAAGLACAKRLRELDHHRKIVIIDKDSDSPYERPPLSKALVGPSLSTSGRADLEAADICLVTAEAKALDTEKRLVETSKFNIHFDELVLAPGSTPRTASWSNPDVFNVHSLKDNSRLRTALTTASSALVIGGGFIGAEVAASLKKAGLDAKLLFRDEQLFLKRLGPEAASVIEQVHREAGVDLVPNAQVQSVTATDSQQLVALENGQNYKADLVVSGIGSAPDTAWLHMKVGINASGMVTADSALRTNRSGIWAAGDSVSWITPDGISAQSGHWTTAKDQGIHIAEDIVRGSHSPFIDAPYFWSMQHNNLLQGVGSFDAGACEREVVIAEGPRTNIFVTYKRQGALHGAFGLNSPQGVLAVRNELNQPENIASVA